MSVPASPERKRLLLPVQSAPQMGATLERGRRRLPAVRSLRQVQGLRRWCGVRDPLRPRIGGGRAAVSSEMGSCQTGYRP
jgi:hypothetical protein